MKNIVLIFVLFFCTYNVFGQSNSEEINKSVVKNIVLINKNPWEVLMTKNGDILAKLKSKPNYLKGYETSSENYTPITPAYEKSVVVAKKKEYAPVSNESVSKVETKVSNDKVSPIDEDRLQVTFNLGSALLSSDDITLLNKIAAELDADRNLKYNVFGFNSEPEYRFYILSKRRMDAVLSYLNVKGVDIDKQIIVNSAVKGKNNKIVFAPLR